MVSRHMKHNAFTDYKYTQGMHGKNGGSVIMLSLIYPGEILIQLFYIEYKYSLQSVILPTPGRAKVKALPGRLYIKLNHFESYMNSPRKGCPRGMKICVWTHLGLIKLKTTPKTIKMEEDLKKNGMMENNLKKMRGKRKPISKK
jgi:hypothetical protein